MNDIKEIEKSADEDSRTFGQLMDIVVEKLTYGALMLRERRPSSSAGRRWRWRTTAWSVALRWMRTS